MEDIVQPQVKFEFDRFLLDCPNAQLSKAGKQLNLTPKAFSVLTHLVVAQGGLVKKDTLFDTVWAGTVVSESALTVCIREIRKVLGDSSRNPRFIETVHKRGYRFITAVNEFYPQPVPNKKLSFQRKSKQASIINRKKELQQLDDAFSLAAQGHRQLAFITGEAGIGKTSLMDAHKSDFHKNSDCRYMHGQCFEHELQAEPYLPWLDALTNLYHQDHCVLEIYKRYAPMWLLHTPSLLDISQRDELQLSLAGSSRARMFREMIDLLHELSSTNLLVIYLDDMHYCDAASLELLSSIARRHEQAKLMIVATFRPVDKFLSTPINEVKQELSVRQLCRELPLSPFCKSDIQEYLDVRFSENKFPKGFAKAIIQCTDGNPLFVMNVIQHLVQLKQLRVINDHWMLDCDLEFVIDCVPENLAQMIGSHVESLSVELKEILEVAAVASTANTKEGHFCTAEIAHALQMDLIQIQDECDQLVEQKHLLNSVQSGQWPDETLLIRYTFNHGLYLKAFYKNISPARRAKLHLSLGERLLEAFSDFRDEVALNLAIHFEQGREYKKAAFFLKKSAEIAFQRGLNSEAIKSLRRAFELSTLITDSQQRLSLEMDIHSCLGTVLIADQGNNAPEVEENYLQARQLGELLGCKTKLFPVIFGLRSCCLFSGRLQQAHQFSQQLLELAKQLDDNDLLVEAHVALASTSHFLGHFSDTFEHSKLAIKYYHPNRHAFHIINYGLDPGVYCLGRAAQSLYCLGHVDQALTWAKDCKRAAEKMAHPYSLTFAFNKLAWIYLLRNQAKHAQKWSTHALEHSNKHGYAFFKTWASVTHNWALVAGGDTQKGLSQMQTCLAIPVSMADGVRSYLLTIYADACFTGQDYHQAGEILDSIVDGAENFMLAKRLILRGKLILASQTDAIRQHQEEINMAKICFNKAIECAITQQSLSYELQAKTCMAKLMQNIGDNDGAVNLLAPIVQSTSEGHETSDFIEAKHLLGALQQHTGCS